MRSSLRRSRYGGLACRLNIESKVSGEVYLSNIRTRLIPEFYSTSDPRLLTPYAQAALYKSSAMPISLSGVLLLLRVF